MASELSGRTAIITGAARGIGLAAVRTLVSYGMNIVAFDLPDAPFDEVLSLSTSDAKVVRFTGDVASSADWSAAVAAALDQTGRVDLLFNNAGIPGDIASILDCSEELFERVMAVNVRGVFLGIRHVGRAMRDGDRGGAIVNTSSVSGLEGSPRLPAYSASKHAVIGLTKSAAKELARYRIRVNAVCPSPTETEMMRIAEDHVAPGDRAAGKRAFTGGIPLGRYAEPAEIAALVAYLASDGAAFVTGAAIPIDGGLTA